MRRYKCSISGKNFYRVVVDGQAYEFSNKSWAYRFLKEIALFGGFTEREEMRWKTPQIIT